MNNSLTPNQIAFIDSTLPPLFAALKSKYPYTILNAADFWNEPPFPKSYIPHELEIYYGEGDTSDAADSCPDLLIEDGVLQPMKLKHLVEVVPPDVCQILADGQWAYIEVEGVVLLNRLEDLVLPQVQVEQAVKQSFYDLLTSNPALLNLKN